MNNITFQNDAWSDYIYWQTKDKKTLNRINLLLKDLKRGGATDGIGKPEPLRHRKEWSRRIDHENRLVYTLDDKGDIVIIACRGHY